MNTNTLASPTTAGKPISEAPEDASHTEFLVSLLRVATLRARIAACEFDCVGVRVAQRPCFLRGRPSLAG